MEATAIPRQPLFSGSAACCPGQLPRRRRPVCDARPRRAAPTRVVVPAPARHTRPVSVSPLEPFADVAALRALIREIADYPEPGVTFKDITPILADARGLAGAVVGLSAPFHGQVDLVAGIEARGFILGAPVALALGAGFIPLRKMGKLPGPTVAVGYALEYGEATLEVHVDALAAGERVLIVDDVVATGGTARAAIDLVGRAGGSVVGLTALLEIARLGGRAQLSDIAVHTVLVD
jgi:adenine phosphoribosyltransferase